MTRREILDYEIRSSWWAKRIGIGRLQALAGSYFAWKVRRKFARWQESKRMACVHEFSKSYNGRDGKPAVKITNPTCLKCGAPKPSPSKHHEHSRL